MRVVWICLTLSSCLFAFNNCDMKGAPEQLANQSSSAPNPTPTSPQPTGTPAFNQDFLDVIGAPINTAYTQQVSVSGFTGTRIADVSGGNAQISLDGVNFSASQIVSNGSTIYVRQSSSTSANDHRIAVLSVGGASQDWAVSTASAVRTYSAPGTYQEAKIPVGRTLRVECWGGGGGGGGGGGSGSNGAGGGGGGYSTLDIPRSSLAANEPVTIGAGGPGVGGGQNASGTSGGASSFGMHLTAAGGAGGGAASQGAAAGEGGTGLTANGSPGSGLNGGKGGGAGGGTGGVFKSVNGPNGVAPGGGGAASTGAGGGGAFGNGGAATGAGGAGKCVTTIIP